ncbi:hypothetical protein LXA43DRAFT_891990, partial [Ganoderma leucocontextum]
MSDRSQLPTWLLAGLLMVTVLHTLSNIARPDAAYALSALKVVIFGVFSWSSAMNILSVPQQDLLGEVPADIRTVFTRLGVEADIIHHAAC